MGNLLKGVVSGVRSVSNTAKEAYNKVADPIREANNACKVDEEAQRKFLESINTEVTKEVDEKVTSVCTEMGLDPNDPVFEDRVKALRETFSGIVKKTKLAIYQYDQQVKHIENSATERLQNNLQSFEKKNAIEIENRQMRAILTDLYKERLGK